MTVTQRKSQNLPDEISSTLSGVEYSCDSCQHDLTHAIRIKCADPVCTTGEGVDICPQCFCAGKEFGSHKRYHAYRVIEINSYPIFTEDWGADEELQLLTGISLHGLGNWKKIAEHVGTRTKEEVERHYNVVYVDSPDWPLPIMDKKINTDPVEFKDQKRRRVSDMHAKVPPVPKTAPTSTPGIHEIAGYLPGRLEFEHELDNEAEHIIKDLEFGICLQYGGDKIAEDEEDLDVRARQKWIEEKKAEDIVFGRKVVRKSTIKGPVNGKSTGIRNDVKQDAILKIEDCGDADDEEEPMQPLPTETPDSLDFKLTLLEMYSQRVEKRLESKALIINRGLLEYKKMQSIDKKRPKEEREIVNRLRPFARLQTAENYEAFATDLYYEATLRKTIIDLQAYRRLGLCTCADIEKYNADLNKQTQAKISASRECERGYIRSSGRHSIDRDDGRRSYDREATPRLFGSGPSARRLPTPLNLANSPSLHLLTPPEQALCSTLRILPKPYLVIKETLVREYARRGGKLRRREARDLVKIDVNKTSRIWDFLVQAGFLKITNDNATAIVSETSKTNAATLTNPLINSSILKEQGNAPSRTPQNIVASSSVGSQNGSASLASTPK